MCDIFVPSYSQGVYTASAFSTEVFNPEAADSTFLRNAVTYLQIHTTLLPAWDYLMLRTDKTDFKSKYICDIMNSKQRTAGKGSPSAWGSNEGLRTFHHKI
jgi:hypothetical protein